MSAVYPSNGSFSAVSGVGLSLPSPAGGTAAATSPAPWNAGFATPGVHAPLPAGLQAGRRSGLIIVVALHVFIAWALGSGLARQVIESVKSPIEMIVVPEEAPQPPPPPPPKVEKIEKIKETPRPVPPPAYVPPPDVVSVAPPVPVITAVQSTPPPAPVVIEPPPPPAPLPVPKVEAAKQEIGVACPGYQAVIADAMESAFERVGIPGTVRTLLKVRGTEVTDVIPQSGPKPYYKLLQTAIKRMRCAAVGDAEVHVTLDVVFQP